MVLSITSLTLFTVNIENVSAVGEQSSDNSTSNSTGNSTANSTGNSDNATSSQTKLGSENLKSCQKREAVMNNIVARVADRGQKQIQVVESIEAKVKSFYSEKNLSVAEHDNLMANIEAKKQVAVTVMNSVRAMKGGINCGGEDPKGVASQFKTDASAQSSSVDEYKDAVHDFAVAIKTSLNDITATEEN